MNKPRTIKSSQTNTDTRPAGGSRDVNVTRERIRKIEIWALRHPSRIQPLEAAFCEAL